MELISEDTPIYLLTGLVIPTRSIVQKKHVSSHNLFCPCFLPPANQRLPHEVLRDVYCLSGARRPASQNVLPSPDQQVEQKSVADTVRGGHNDLGKFT